MASINFGGEIMGCPASLAALQAVEANTKAIRESLCKEVPLPIVVPAPISLETIFKELEVMKNSLLKLEDLVKPDIIDSPGNTLDKIPDGWTEDIKRFTVGDGVADVAAVDVDKQLTEMATANQYIIKEVYFYASGTFAADATHSIKDTESKTVFAQGYHAAGSFYMITGNRNGIIGKPLTQKPTVTLNSGTGMAAQKWYGSVKYYFR